MFLKSRVSPWASTPPTPQRLGLFGKNRASACTRPIISRFRNNTHGGGAALCLWEKTTNYIKRDVLSLSCCIMGMSSIQLGCTYQGRWTAACICSNEMLREKKKTVRDIERHREKEKERERVEKRGQVGSWCWCVKQIWLYYRFQPTWIHQSIYISRNLHCSGFL